MEASNLDRFTEAQENTYQKALREIRQGSKQSHWMWFIFPQIRGLGFSETSRFYALKNISEAMAYLEHPVLGQRLLEISEALLSLENMSASEIFGSADDLKLKSCMTLFSTLENTSPVFSRVLEKYFNGAMDRRTLDMLNEES